MTEEAQDRGTGQGVVTVDVDPFSPEALRNPYPMWAQLRDADALVDGLLQSGRFDGVGDVAEAYVLKVFPESMGIDLNREQAIAVGDLNFNSLGLNNELVPKSREQGAPFIEWWEGSLKGQTMKPGGFGEKLFLANRDPRKWSEPDAFDIRRATAGHVALGTGIHACVGQMIARLEFDCVLNALLAKVGRIELDGTPRHRLSNALHTLDELPLKVRAHA
ncbi:MAG: hypothetical protein Q8N17_19560 [Burkholderiaceae bacterium]|nr:hypothetical protein [Burkholderiaceae bacterium]